MIYPRLRHPLFWTTTVLLVVTAAASLRTPRLSAASRMTAPDDRAAAGAEPRSALAARDTAVFAGGCFWGIEAVFEHLKGVTSAVSGYSGGSVPKPSYEQVSAGNTSHAEAVQVVYDPAQITYAQLLKVFFTVAHDPTQRDRQGPDVGPQYRSVVFYRDTLQRQAVKKYLAELDRAKVYPQPIVTEIVPLRIFYPAEDYHQDYMAHHPTQPYIVIHDKPKVERLQREFPDLYRTRQSR